jgi:alpha-1,4-digalacturonate transport system permease protein
MSAVAAGTRQGGTWVGGRLGRRRAETAALWLLLAGGAVVMLFPIYWMFATAIRPKDQIFSGETNVLPTGWVWQNFADALERMPFLHWAWNSIVIAVVRWRSPCR